MIIWRVIGDHVHAEAAADIDEDPADLAGAHHADGFSVEIKSCQPVQGEIEFPGAVIGLMDPPDGGEQQRDGMLSYRIRGIGRNMHDMDLPEGSPEIHVVVAGRAQRDQTDTVFIKPVDHSRVYGVIHENTNGIAALRQVHGILVQFGFQVLETDIVQAAVLFKGRFVICLCVEKSHFDHAGSSFSIQSDRKNVIQRAERTGYALPERIRTDEAP